MKSDSHDAMRDLALSLSRTSLVCNTPTSSGDDAPLVLTPSESLASAILDIVSDIRRMKDDDHHGATHDAKHEAQATPTKSDIPDGGRDGSTRLNIRRLWQLGRESSSASASASASSSSQHQEKPKARHHRDENGWTALMDGVVLRTNHLIATQTVVENDPFLKSRNPPLFWLLFDGHE